MNINFEKRIPTNIDEAMVELDRRIMIAFQEGQMSGQMAQINLRKIVYELLKDFQQGLEAKKGGLIIQP